MAVTQIRNPEIILLIFFFQQSPVIHIPNPIKLTSKYFSNQPLFFFFKIPAVMLSLVFLLLVLCSSVTYMIYLIMSLPYFKFSKGSCSFSDKNQVLWPNMQGYWWSGLWLSQSFLLLPLLVSNDYKFQQYQTALALWTHHVVLLFYAFAFAISFTPFLHLGDFYSFFKTKVRYYFFLEDLWHLVVSFPQTKLD